MAEFLTDVPDESDSHHHMSEKVVINLTPMKHNHWRREGGMYIYSHPNPSTAGHETEEFTIYCYKAGENPLNGKVAYGEIRGDKYVSVYELKKDKKSSGREMKDNGIVNDKTGRIDFSTSGDKWFPVSNPPQPPTPPGLPPQAPPPPTPPTQIMSCPPVKICPPCPQTKCPTPMACPAPIPCPTVQCPAQSKTWIYISLILLLALLGLLLYPFLKKMKLNTTAKSTASPTMAPPKKVGPGPAVGYLSPNRSGGPTMAGCSTYYPSP